MRRSLHIGLVVLLSLGAAACAPTKSNVTKDSGPQGPPTVEVTGSDNGSEIHTAIGHLLHVVLEGQGWSFDATPGGIVRITTPSATSIPVDCSGPRQTEKCGTASITYTATAAGTVTLRATRSMCGEARLCTGTEGNFTLTAVIGRGVTSR
mgnify:CR=1 FL=1